MKTLTDKNNVAFYYDQSNNGSYRKSPDKSNICVPGFNRALQHGA